MLVSAPRTRYAVRMIKLRQYASVCPSDEVCSENDKV
jgi:hypothetical protein